jgi:membrane protease YdiL (CAAX protease family)
MKTYLDAALEGKNDWWRFLIAYPFIIITWFVIGSIPIIALAAVVALDNNPLTGLASTGFVGIDPLLSFTVNMSSFIPFILATIIAVILIHKRPVRTLVTPEPKINWKRIFAGMGTWAVLAAVVAVVESLLYPGRYTFTPNITQFIPFAIVSVLIVPIQTSSEELFFRGYLIQNIGLKIKNSWILSLLSGFLFTLPHLANPEVSVNAVLVPLFYFFFGAFATLVTLHDNGLELALGMHAGNNLFTALFVNATITALPTPALFIINELDAIYNLISPLIAMAVFYMLMFKVWPKKVNPAIEGPITTEP